MATSHIGDSPSGLVDQDNAAKAPEVYQDNAAKAPEVDPRNFGTLSESPGQVHSVEEKKLPFGWSLWALLTLAATISALCIGAVFDSHADDPAFIRSSPSPTATQTTSPAENTSCPAAEADDTSDYAPVLPKDMINLRNLTKPDNCERPGGPHDIRSSSGLQYTYYCDFDAPSSEDIHDEQRFLSYTLLDCIDACTYMNQLAELNRIEHNSNGSRCDSVVFSWEITESWQEGYANCWLKSGAAERKQTFTIPGTIYAEPSS
ncbi:hypothetical protein FIE12Z_7115 [Fusarium flagelliforme]|uniref:Uncharacterized protein n=1 Tax=Fusarium flagelliforme TaxID=2675880 RepID=A0A395MNI3_9HYPO|nr:hypothetical protein FIE12Z_7115 [Fusarium flagelliforme]